MAQESEQRRGRVIHLALLAALSCNSPEGPRIGLEAYTRFGTPEHQFCLQCCPSDGSLLPGVSSCAYRGATPDIASGSLPCETSADSAVNTYRKRSRDDTQPTPPQATQPIKTGKRGASQRFNTTHR